ncbi:MAG: YciK family oxidoreductase [Wigglesworthia glossinidia]|nr:YciK family oxidoreductase [Wigglesworthia glossinidia]
MPNHKTFIFTKNFLLNKYILITGASDGIGKEAAITYTKYGANVILLGKSKNKLVKVKQEMQKYNTRAIIYILVINLESFNQNQYRLIFNQIQNKIPCLHGLLNNAGILGKIAPIIQQNPKYWKKVINVNLNGTFMITQTFLPLLLKAKHPSIIFTTSGITPKGRAHWGAYAVSKFAIDGLMKVLSSEYSKFKLRVNSINPGSINTKMRKIAFPKENNRTLAKDIMYLYLYLMSDMSYKKTGIRFDANKIKKI